MCGIPSKCVSLIVRPKLNSTQTREIAGQKKFYSLIMSFRFVFYDNLKYRTTISCHIFHTTQQMKMVFYRNQQKSHSCPVGDPSIGSLAPSLDIPSKMKKNVLLHLHTEQYKNEKTYDWQNVRVCG